jgi:hypothetical protein
LTDDRAFGADDVAGASYVGKKLRKLRFLMTDNIFELLTLDVGSGFTLRRTVHDLPQLRSPSGRLWFLYFCSLGLRLAFDTRVLLAILYRLGPLSFVIGPHMPNLLENC